MKVRNRSRRLDISQIFITKNSDGYNDIIIIYNNNKVFKTFTKSMYLDSILDNIDGYSKLLESE